MDEQKKKIDEIKEKMDLLSSRVNDLQRELGALRVDLRELSGGQRVREDVMTPAVTDTRAGGNSGESSTSGRLENFIGLQLIHLVGIVVLVMGISIGVKYAIDKQLISESLRILLAYLAGLVLFILSVRLKSKYHLFSAILFAGSMASVYFTTYAAFVYYQFLPPLAAFLLMMAFTVFTSIKAIHYNLKEIAIIGMIGAYGIPLLVSANAERIDLFFSYILLINLGVFFLAYKRSWKLMVQLALVITWTLFIGWALFNYSSSDRFIASLFIISYFLLFLATSFAFPIRRKQHFTGGEVWQILLNNTALYVACLLVFQNGVVEEASLAGVTGFIFLVVSVLSALTRVLFPSERDLHVKLILQSLLLLLLFIAFEWDGVIVTLLWIAVAVILFAWGVIGKLSWARLASVFLVAITLVKLLFIDSSNFSTVQKIISYIVIGIILLTGSFYYQKLGLSGNKRES